MEAKHVMEADGMRNYKTHTERAPLEIISLIMVKSKEVGFGIFITKGNCPNGIHEIWNKTRNTEDEISGCSRSA